MGVLKRTQIRIRLYLLEKFFLYARKKTFVKKEAEECLKHIYEMRACLKTKFIPTKLQEEAWDRAREAFYKKALSE